ncbi:hypothetical protein PL373_00645 [Tenacibaculum maritimum]|nr:hypothetical protein [Tenacibaculum maritimum]
MKKSEVLNVAGEPKEQKQVFGFDYWAYEQGMVVLSKDTVMEIPNLENLKKALIEVDKGLGKLKDDLKQ